MKKLILAAAMGAAMLGGGVAVAQQPAPAAPPQKAQKIRHFDPNGDGIQTRAEALARADAMFARLDTNKDGKVTADERQAARKAMMERRPGRRGGERHGMGHGGEPGRGIGRIDGDRDGTVSQAEFRARALERFDRIDANRDGRIDASERAAAREKMRAMRAERRDG